MPGNEPLAVKALACGLPGQAWHTVTWREGTNTELSSRFAGVRVRCAHRDYLGTEMRAEEWLLIECSDLCVGQGKLPRFWVGLISDVTDPQLSAAHESREVATQHFGRSAA